MKILLLVAIEKRARTFLFKNGDIAFNTNISYFGYR